MGDTWTDNIEELWIDGKSEIFSPIDCCVVDGLKRGGDWVFFPEIVDCGLAPPYDQVIIYNDKAAGNDFAIQTIQGNDWRPIHIAVHAQQRYVANF